MDKKHHTLKHLHVYLSIGGPLITRSSCNADFPNTAVLVRVRGGVRTIYLINCSNAAYFEQAQKSALQEDPLYNILWRHFSCPAGRYYVQWSAFFYASMTVLILDAHARNELHCGAFKLNVDKPVRKFTNFEWQMLLDKP